MHRNGRFQVKLFTLTDFKSLLQFGESRFSGGGVFLLTISIMNEK